MRKKEIIWREILVEILKSKKREFTQKDLAKKFNISLSTVFNALKVPRASNAIKVTGRYFELIDAEKLLYIWANARNINKDIIYQTHIDQGAAEIENHLPPEVIFGAYSAYKMAFKDTPADYDKVYVYASHLAEIKKRFPPKKGYPNLIIFKADAFLKNYGEITPPPQIFADLWNLPEWYAKDYLSALKEKLRGILA